MEKQYILIASKDGREFVRMRVRIRDNFTCQDCGLTRTPESIEKNNKTKDTLKGKIKHLDVHHLNGMCGKKSLDYDKLNEMDGLVTLCHKCHFNRPEHASHIYNKNSPARIEQTKKRLLVATEMRLSVLSLRTGGLSFNEIGAKFGFTRQRAHQLFIAGKKLKETPNTSTKGGDESPVTV